MWHVIFLQLCVYTCLHLVVVGHKVSAVLPTWSMFVGNWTELCSKYVAKQLWHVERQHHLSWKNGSTSCWATCCFFFLERQFFYAANSVPNGQPDQRCQATWQSPRRQHPPHLLSNEEHSIGRTSGSKELKQNCWSMVWKKNDGNNWNNDGL